MKLSVVTSLYRSEPHLSEFVARASAAAAAFAGDDWEMILVNDGSPMLRWRRRWRSGRRSRGSGWWIFRAISGITRR